MSTPAPSPDPLRAFLRAQLSPEQLHRIASADYGRDADAIAVEFKHNLGTGSYTYAGDGNPYECALLQCHDDTADRPLNELFGAWWLGTFCSDPQNFVLIDNLVPNGVNALSHMTVRGCAELGQNSSTAAMAALPFVTFVQARDPFPLQGAFNEAAAALEAIEQLGPASSKTWQLQSFMSKFDTRN